jgi:hypothetical protein
MSRYGRTDLTEELLTWDSGWVSVYLNTEQHIACAIEIPRSKYDQIKWKSEMKND